MICGIAARASDVWGIFIADFFSENMRRGDQLLHELHVKLRHTILYSLSVPVSFSTLSEDHVTTLVNDDVSQGGVSIQI